MKKFGYELFIFFFESFEQLRIVDIFWNSSNRIKIGWEYLVENNFCRDVKNVHGYGKFLEIERYFLFDSMEYCIFPHR